MKPPASLALSRQRQEDQEVKASLGGGRPYLRDREGQKKKGKTELYTNQTFRSEFIDLQRCACSEDTTRSQQSPECGKLQDKPPGFLSR